MNGHVFLKFRKHWNSIILISSTCNYLGSLMMAKKTNANSIENWVNYLHEEVN